MNIHADEFFGKDLKVYDTKMTETIQTLKEDIAVLQEKLKKLEEIEKQPRMNLQQEGEYAVVLYHDKVYYRLECEYTFSWYIKKDESEYKIHYRSPNLVMVEDAETERLLEGLYYNHIQVKKEKVAQEPEENEWKSVALRFGEKLSGYLSDGYYELSPAAWFRWAVFNYDNYIKQRDIESGYHPTPHTPEQIEKSLREAFQKVQQTEEWKETQRKIDSNYDELVENDVSENKQKPKTLYDILYRWWMDIFCNPIYRYWDMETSIEHLVDRIEFWNMRIKNDDEVEFDEQENDKNFKNSLDLIKEWGEKNKPQTLTDLIYDWWERVFGDTDDTETCIENLVDEISLWLPTEHDTNSYKWNECIRMIREKLR